MAVSIVNTCGMQVCFAIVNYRSIVKTIYKKTLQSPCGQDDDLSPGWGHTHLHTGVAILSKLTSQELVQLCLEDTVCHELRREERVSLHMIKNDYTEVKHSS